MCILIRLRSAKKTDAGDSSGLLLRGAGAHLMVEWRRAAETEDGFVSVTIARFRMSTLHGLTAEGIRSVFYKQAETAGYPSGYASLHGHRPELTNRALSQDVLLA